MKKILVLAFLCLPTLVFAVSVKLTVRDLSPMGGKRGTKLITMVDSRSLTAEDQILFSAEVRADGKKYANIDKRQFEALRAKLLLLGVVLHDDVMEAWMDSPLNLTARSLQHQFIHRGYALTFMEQKRERGFQVVHFYFFKPDN